MNVTSKRYDAPANTVETNIDFVATFVYTSPICCGRHLKPIQIIYVKPTTPNPVTISHVLANFDIDICRVAMRSEQHEQTNNTTYQKHFITSPQVEDAINCRKATVMSTLLLTRTILRAIKYASRGFKFNDGMTEMMQEFQYQIPYE